METVVLLLWLRLILFVLGIVLLIVWFATGRRNSALRIAGAVAIIAGSLLALMSRFQ